MAHLPEPKPPYTTLASTIKNLEKKGYLVKRVFGNSHLYKAKITEQRYQKNFFGYWVKQHFENSYKNLVSFFVNEKKLSSKELKEIIDNIENNK